MRSRNQFMAVGCSEITKCNIRFGTSRFRAILKIHHSRSYAFARARIPRISSFFAEGYVSLRRTQDLGKSVGALNHRKVYNDGPLLNPEVCDFAFPALPAIQELHSDIPFHIKEYIILHFRMGRSPTELSKYLSLP